MTGFEMVYFLLSDFTFFAFRFGLSISETSTLSMSERFWEINFCWFHFQLSYGIFPTFRFHISCLEIWIFHFGELHTERFWEIISSFQMSYFIASDLSCFSYFKSSAEFLHFDILPCLNISVDFAFFNVCFWSKFSRTHDIYIYIYIYIDSCSWSKFFRNSKVSYQQYEVLEILIDFLLTKIPWICCGNIFLFLKILVQR